MQKIKQASFLNRFVHSYHEESGRRIQGVCTRDDGGRVVVVSFIGNEFHCLKKDTKVVRLMTIHDYQVYDWAKTMGVEE